MKLNKLKFDDLFIAEDDDILAVNKPPFLASLDDRNDKITLLKLAKKHSDNLSPCHRLDKETSGIMLLAKNEKAYKHIALQFQNRDIEKVYHCVIEKIKNFKNEEIDAPIGSINAEKVSFDPDSKPSLTIINTLKAYKKHSLLKCNPVTGRKHQIRFHLSYIGFPIVGDVLYHGNPFYLSSVKKNYKLKKWEDEQPLIKRTALHAYSISYFNMANEKIINSADYPKDFRVLLDQLEKNKY